MIDRFTKSDLRNGDVCVTENEEVYIVLFDIGVLLTKDGSLRLEDYDNNFIFCNRDLAFASFVVRNHFNLNRAFDIKEIYRPIEPQHCSFDPVLYKDGEKVFHRKNKITVTIEEIAKWKNVLPEQIEVTGV